MFMRVSFKLMLAVVAALFTAAWAVCDQLIGLGAGTSFAVAGVLSVIVVPWLAGSVPRRREHRVNPDTLGKSTRRDVRDADARQHARTLVTQHIKLIVDDAGFQVQKMRRTGAAGVWENYLQICWREVKAIAFATGRYDPIVALYAWTTAGVRHHVADSRFLSQPEWIKFGVLISEATHGKLTLDLAGRDDPRSLGPDW
jgi:hypothetical protein